MVYISKKFHSVDVGGLLAVFEKCVGQETKLSTAFNGAQKEKKNMPH